MKIREWFRIFNRTVASPDRPDSLADLRAKLAASLEKVDAASEQVKIALENVNRLHRQSLERQENYPARRRGNNAWLN
jgi:hypothetical protein